MKLQLSRTALVALTGLWAVLILVPLAQVSGAHYFPFLAKPLAGIPAEPDPRMRHFLGTTCGCSEKVLKYLEGRGPQVAETVHIVGPGGEWEKRLAAKGFVIEVLNEEEAHARYALESVPQLLIVDGGRVLYQGGYNEDQRHNEKYEDLALWRDLAARKPAAAFPLYGCANGKFRKAQLDPWKMKYE